ncbi:hypothetical protein O181_040200 [Austropuccinia psidii MF-1]|uniref:Uncharacterized protein n=1 Tax=Austropuccinia psidii MF-1 TaxID=1389203 RepID=A0A9Q3HFW6_9BASI|nr:hypothetical protein [Austropuccinia psidii MF-1]
MSCLCSGFESQADKEGQPGIPQGRAWNKLPGDISQIDTLQTTYGNHQRMESHQEVQPPGGEGNQDKGESSQHPTYRRKDDPARAYYDSFRLTRSRPTQLPSGFKLFRHQKISGQESQLLTIPGSFKEKKRIQGQKQDIFQQKEERVRKNDPEAVGVGERTTQTRNSCKYF